MTVATDAPNQLTFFDDDDDDDATTTSCLVDAAVRFTQKLNAHLGELNIEYQSKAQSGRIKFADVKRLKAGTLEAYKSFCVQAGQREGQFKVVKLQYRADVPFPFEEHLEP